MFFSFVDELRAAGHLRLDEGASDPARGARRRRDRGEPGGILLSRPRHLREGRGAARPLRPGLRQGLQGARDQLRQRGGAAPRGMAEGDRRALSDARADGRDQGARLVGGDHGGAEAAARGAAGAPPGRQQVDRHRRHLAVRQFAATIRKGVRIGGESRQGRALKVWEQREFQQSRQQGRARHAQHQGRAAPPAPLRPRRRRRRARPRRDDRRHRAQGLARHPRCGPSGTMR